MAKQAMIVYGGWEGHTPEASAKVFEPVLQEAGYDVAMENTLDAYGEADRVKAMDLIVPIWTAGQLTGEQWQSLREAVYGGTALAGFHAGMLDAFRSNPGFQFMVGGQWVAHPGNQETKYTVEIADKQHPIMDGMADFELSGTEQYYLHVDPGVHVLARTTFTGDFGDTATYPPGTVMPYVWTRTFGEGRIFVAAWGHTHADFDKPEANEIVRRGMLWAAGDL